MSEILDLDEDFYKIINDDSSEIIEEDVPWSLISGESETDVTKSEKNKQITADEDPSRSLIFGETDVAKSEKNEQGLKKSVVATSELNEPVTADEDPSSLISGETDVAKSEKNKQITADEDPSRSLISGETDVAKSEKNEQGLKKSVVATSELYEPKWPPGLLQEIEEAAERRSSRKVEKEEILAQRNMSVLEIHQLIGGG